MKAVKEKALEQSFVRVINRLIGSKEEFLIDENRSMSCGYENIDTRLAELQKELTILVRMTGNDNPEHSGLVNEIEKLRERKQRLKDTEVEKVWRDRMGEEFKAYLVAQDSLLDMFDGDLFRRLIEKVKVRSMVEVEFMFKAEVECGRYFEKKWLVWGILSIRNYYFCFMMLVSFFMLCTYFMV